MARRPDLDDDDAPPPPPKKAPKRPPVEVEAAPTPSEPDDGPADGPKPLTELSDKGLLKRMLRYREEFMMLAGDASQAAMTRRIELTRLMRAIQDVRDAREPLIEVTVPRSVTGEPFVLGPRSFHPGTHIVRSSIAQYLLWMISENQRVELNRLKSNGRTIDLGVIGNRARLARIARDDGSDDYGGRGQQ